MTLIPNCDAEMKQLVEKFEDMRWLQLVAQACFLDALEIDSDEAVMEVVKNQPDREQAICDEMLDIRQLMCMGLCAEPDEEQHEKCLQSWLYMSSEWRQTDLIGHLSMKRWTLEHKLSADLPVVAETGSIQPSGITS